MSDLAEKQFVVVGLGNPGKKYALTRHNMGYLVVQALAQEQGWDFKEVASFQANVTKGRIGNVLVHLLLPLTYMNESGQAVRRYLDYYKLNPQHAIVVVDDTALSFGTSRVRSIGSAGGHNGLKSIQTHLHTQHYVRLRMGIGREQPNQPLVEYVLDTFSVAEKNELMPFVERGVAIVKRLMVEEVSAVMNSVNSRQNELNKTS